MLYSAEKCTNGKKRPVFSAWFGNFFEPYFSDKDKVDSGIRELMEFGINSIVLDSKLWSDFTTYFKTGEMSQYVEMQNFIQKKCIEYGMGVSFLALFANGDNLYPEIYDNPPEYVEQPTNFQGQTYRGYRHWSEKQMDEHVRHCLDLYRFIAKDAAAKAKSENDSEKLPFFFYHSPIFSPCFDQDGQAFYLNWLRSNYTLDEINKRYATSYKCIDDIDIMDYWVYPNEGEGALCGIPKERDYVLRTEVILKYADNQRFKRWVMKDYFKKITAKLKDKDPRFYLYSALCQWKLFFNDNIHIQNRGWDLWDLGESLDSPTFITLPVDTYGDANAYVVPCELAMLRSAARDKDFIGGLFLGRYMSNDIYEVYSPSEIIASAYGTGATELYFYGYNGLDDGGNFGKWGEKEKASLKRGLDWFADVRESSGKRTKEYEAAIIFPFASYTLVNHTENWKYYSGFRSDLMGWYRQLADHGINADILHLDQVKLGLLEKYKVIIIPADPLYWAMKDVAFEKEIKLYVEAGGILLHSVSDAVQSSLGIKYKHHAPDSFQWEEKVITDSTEFVSYEKGNVMAKYLDDGENAIVLNNYGKGSVYSFGFYYGYAYETKKHLPVPRSYGKENHYPFTVTARTPVDMLLEDNGLSKGRNRGVEKIRFEHGQIIINHTPYTYSIQHKRTDCISTFDGFDGVNLPGHHAVYIP